MIVVVRVFGLFAARRGDRLWPLVAVPSTCSAARTRWFAGRPRSLGVHEGKLSGPKRTPNNGSATVSSPAIPPMWRQSRSPATGRQR